MEIVLLMARLFLASVFAIAGIAKTADPAGGRKAMIGFGVSEKLATPLGRFLPIVEICVALSLIPLGTAWLGAVAALPLMLIFVVAIGVSLLRGRTPECNCFGQLHSTPVSWSMFARNLALAGVAALIVVGGKKDPGLSVLGWIGDLKTVEMLNLLVSCIAVGLLVTAVMYLRRVLNQQARVLERIDSLEKLIEEYAPPPVEHGEMVPPLEGLPVGAPAPEFSLFSIGGEEVTLEGLLALGKSVLLLFVSPNCSPCETVLADVEGWERDYSDRLTIAVLSKGSSQENQDRVLKYAPRHLLLLGESDAAERYQSKWTPAALLIRRPGRIASQNAYGDQEIRALVANAITASEVTAEDGSGAAWNGHRLQIKVGTSALKVGDPAPAFSISDLHGNVVHIQDLLGRDTLLLFWDPGCPFCQAMSADLMRWEENPPKGAPQLVFVASGDAQRAKAASENYKSRFLHDSDSQLGPLLGTRSTPSAVLIDREGRIASSVATGSTNVLALAGVHKVATPIASGVP